MQFNISCVIHMSFVCSSYVIHMSIVCNGYVTSTYSYITRIYWYVIRMSLVYTGMLFVCHPYVTCIYSYVIRILLVCHPYVIRVYSYVIRMSLVCGFTMNLLRLCGEAICRSLNIIFKTCLIIGKFPLERKKGNVFPSHKKENERKVKNYRPVSLLPICGKIFERLTYNMYDFLSDNNLLSPNQSGFRSGYSYINHKGLEVSGIFLHFSKAFDKIWLDGLIFRLHQNGISGDIINILRDFLCNNTKVVLNGQCSS